MTATHAPAEAPAITATGTLVPLVNEGGLKDGITVGDSVDEGDTEGDGVDVAGRLKEWKNWAIEQDEELHTAHVQHGVVMHVGVLLAESAKSLSSLMYE